MNKADLNVHVDGHVLFVELVPFRQMLTFFLSLKGQQSPLISASAATVQNFDFSENDMLLKWPELSASIPLWKAHTYNEPVDCDKVTKNAAWYKKLNDRIKKSELCE